MATTTKSQKEKSHLSAPRLPPRQTTTSVARAAKNATNRNLPSVARDTRTSPTRTVSKTKTTFPTYANAPKRDSRTDCRKSQDDDCENADVLSNATVTQRLEVDEFLINSDVIEDGHTETLVINDSEPYSTTIPPINEIEIQIKDAKLENQANSKVPENPTKSKSRPTTPAKSRPQTPKTRIPTPPEAHSRPKTPTAQTRHHSRPNTPQTPRPGPGETKIPSTLPTTQSQSGRNITQAQPQVLTIEDDTKSDYLQKIAQFQNMKKELDLKQQSIMEMFDALRDLSTSLAQEGSLDSGESFQNQELVVFNVGDWTSHEVAQLCRDAASNSAEAIEFINTAKPIDEAALEELDATVMKVPTCFADLCLQAFTARQELIDWIKDLVEQHESNCGDSVDRIAQYNTEGLQLCDTLRELKSKAADAVDTVTQLSRRACRERSILIAVGESLVREIAQLRHDLEGRTVIVNEMRDIRCENDTAKELEDTRRELEEERAARTILKDKLATSELQLRQTRGRVNKMDKQLRESDATINTLTSSVKTLEEQSRQKEVHLEARARKLKEYLKTGEIASNQVSQQRDNLHNEVQSLKEQIENMTTQNKTAVHELNKEIKELKILLEEQRKLLSKENELRISLEKSLDDSNLIIEDLKAKNTALEKSKPNPELPTEREIELWAELQATKETLRMAEDEATASKREKNRFVETLTKIAESENKVGMQQKLAAELLSKEEAVNKMQAQIRDLTKNIKLNEQKVIQYEQYVRDLQAHNRAIANCQESPNGISYQDLQQEIMDLRMSLLEAVHRNEEMSEIMTQKEQQLEQQDKTSRAQARVIKVREELINMLKNKETEQSRELSGLQQDLEHRMKIVEEVNKQIAAKAEEIQELFATLENKQQQIHRLEKIVLALEEQQRRAQAQRTRHEEKIAALEHELAAGNRRERKFIFF